MLTHTRHSISQTQDYIIAEGESGGWHYIKYANGKATCFGDFTVDVSWTLDSSTNLYYTSWLSKTLPFEILNAVSLISADQTTLCASGGASDNIYVGFRLFRPSMYSAGNVSTNNAKILVAGRWK